MGVVGRGFPGGPRGRGVRGAVPADAPGAGRRREGRGGARERRRGLAGGRRGATRGGRNRRRQHLWRVRRGAAQRPGAPERGGGVSAAHRRRRGRRPRRRGQWEIWTAPLDGGEQKMIGYGLFPSWSPRKDVDRIAYQRPRQRGSRWFSLWTMDLVDGEGRRPTEVAVSPVAAIVTPSWSP